jgi:hypothetical protein
MAGKQPVPSGVSALVATIAATCPTALIDELGQLPEKSMIAALRAGLAAIQANAEELLEPDQVEDHISPEPSGRERKLAATP